MPERIEASRYVVDATKLLVNKSKKVYSMFIPLGENSIIQLVDNFRSRDDIKILHTDLYYIVKIEYQDFSISFYSRGLITIEISSEIDQLGRLIEKIEQYSPMMPHLIKDLVTKYHLSMIEVVLDNIESIPIHKSIVIDSFGETSQEDIPQFGVDSTLTDEEREELLRGLAKDPIVKKFIGNPRSINHRPYEDVIIGINGSIIRSEEIEVLLSYHAYIRSLHLFLTKYNLLIEQVWNNLNRCDDLVDEFEDHIKVEDQDVAIDCGDLFSFDRRSELSKTRFQVIHEIKNTDHFLVLAKFIVNSLGFTTKKFSDDLAGGHIRENSFHIRKVLRVLQDRARHLNIVSESFITRAKTLVTRLNLYDSEIAYETQQRADRISFLESTWRRTFTHGLEPVKIRVAADTVLISNAKGVFSLYLPLGENGIIRLVDSFRSRKDITILDTDLYYYVNIKDDDLTISFYSRGLITVDVELEEGPLSTLIEKAEKIHTKIPRILRKLLTRYHLSLMDVLGEFESVPIHQTIIVERFPKEQFPQNDVGRDQYLRGLSEDPLVLKFIGEPRSVDSGVYEDIIIGTRGSIMRSDQIETLLSYHAYNRALHLFLEKYNLETEKVWTTLNECENLVNKLEDLSRSESKSNESTDKRLDSSDRLKNLRTTRHYVIDAIKNIDNFIVITRFIEESIVFTIGKYSQILESGVVKENSFHIRKVLRTLQDRAKHLTIVSESFSSRGRTLISRIDLYDSEIAFGIQQRMEKLAFIIGLVGILLAVVAIVETFIEILLTLT